MSIPGNDLFEILLRECGRHKPAPVYPGELARAIGRSRETLEAAFDYLRTRGLVCMTDWVQDHGRGFIITPDGEVVLRSPDLLDRLRTEAIYPQPVTLSPPGTQAAEETRPEDRAADIRNALLYPPRPLITYLLLCAILAVFLYGLNLAIQEKVQPLRRYFDLQKDPQIAKILHASGGLEGKDVTESRQWWRLWSYALVQGGGIIGLLLCLGFLYSLGSLSESLWGRARFLGLVLTSTLGGGCAAVLYDPANLALGAFATGCGLLASGIVWFIANHAYLPPEASGWKRGLVFTVVLLALISFFVGGGLAAPLGGAAAGAAFALPCLWNRYHSDVKSFLGLAGMIAVPAVAIGLLLGTAPPRSPLEQFRQRLRWAEVERSLVVTNNQHIKELLKEPRKFLQDADTVQLALDQISRAQETLKATEKLLNQVDPNDFPEWTQKAKQCVSGWRSFLVKIKEILEGPRPDRVNNDLIVEADHLQRLLTKLH